MPYIRSQEGKRHLNEDLDVVFRSTIKYQKESEQPCYYLPLSALTNTLLKQGPSHVVVLCEPNHLDVCKKTIQTAGITCAILDESDPQGAQKAITSCKIGTVEVVIAPKHHFDNKLFKTARYIILLDNQLPNKKRSKLHGLSKKSKQFFFGRELASK